MPNDDPAPAWQQDRVQFWSIDYIRAPIASVFEYLTKGEHTKVYYFGMPISDPVAEGEPVYFGPAPDGSPIVGEVTEFRPPERFAHTFAFGHHEERPSQVEFTLTDIGGGITSLETCHYGFDGLDSPTFNDISSGWPAILSGLKSLLETGEPIEWPQPAEPAEDS